MKKMLSVFAVLVLSAGLAGQDPPKPPVPPLPPPVPAVTIQMPATLDMTAGRVGRLCIDHNAKNVSYDVLSKDVDYFREYDPTNGKVRLCLIYYPPQQFAGEKQLVPLTFYVYAAGASGDSIVTGKTLVTVTIPLPPSPPTPPTPPVPPAPPVPPVPPTPPSPIASDGFRVLITYDELGSANMPASQRNFLTSKQLYDYLNAKCPKVNGTPERRVWPKGVTTAANESKFWQDAWARPRASYPWLQIYTPKGYFEGPLPTDQTEAMNLLKKYGDV